MRATEISSADPSAPATSSVPRSRRGVGPYPAGVTQAPDAARRQTFGGGLLASLVANLGVAIAAIPVAEHWNSRGGEEWAVGLVLGAAVLTGLLGVATATLPERRRWGVGLVAGAVLAPLLVGGIFLWYYAFLHGS
jgi:drug/metabolite transporter (DMT)-like permease